MDMLGLRDIIGPIMVGPSSSHTAGALALARMARRLLATPPARVAFTLYGSFAHTGAGHGTDKALVAGVLGLEPDDLRIRDSLALARETGLDVSFSYEMTADAGHPNTVDIALEGAGGEKVDARGVSVGGGAAAIRRIDGIDVDITGKHTSVVVHQQDEPGVLAHIARCLSDGAVNIATTRMYRTRRGAVAYTVMEVDGAIPDEARRAIEQHPSVHNVRIIPAEDPTAKPEPPANATAPRKPQSGSRPPSASLPASDSRPPSKGAADGSEGDSPSPAPEGRPVEPAASPEDAFDAWDFTDGAELLALCERNACTIAQAFALRERALAALDGRADGTDAYLSRTLAVMREAATKPLAQPEPSMGGLIGGEAHDLSASCQRGAAVIDPLTADAAAFAMAVLETNASMGRIVAAPTAGSAGVLPGVLLALERHRGFNEEILKQGLLTAAAVGSIVARNATVSGAEGGCQAEIGTACAMAAAAAVEMTGGAPDRALDAAANALTSLMGLICDPVGGLVEVPCQKRNASAAATALVCAQVALAGMRNLVSFDETVAALDAVGRTLPFELRESALGGIAAAPSACAWCERRTAH